MDADDGQIQRMRSNAFAMFDRCLDYGTLARRIRQRIGVADGAA
jgi:hypothetical protein